MHIDFGKIWTGEFVARPNRFLMIIKSRKFGTIEAFFPNPGRMEEILLPRVKVYFVFAGDNEKRKTKYTAIAVERNGTPIFLHTHTTNDVARLLIENKLVPTLEKAEIVRAEVTVGHSRFDFLLRDSIGDIYLEVKSCTLFGNGVAMFPDAITERGKRHLLELKELASGTTRSVVLFVVHNSDVEWFIPCYHTDLEFSRTLLAVKEHVSILPVSVHWHKDLTLDDKTRLLKIPWDHLEKEVHDRGAYLLLLRVTEKCNIEVGKLGKLAFAPGTYIYVGSAMKNLDARIARHKRKRKKKHWHVDYLRNSADEIHAVPIRTSERIECKLAEALSSLLKPVHNDFGCSDCRCSTHLFYSKTNPLDTTNFHEFLEGFRMKKPTCD